QHNNNNEIFTTVARFQYSSEAQIVKGRLEADGISVFLSDNITIDTDRVKELISNDKTVFHKSSYELKSPMSPHAAAEIDGVTIDRLEIHEPQTDNYLVIEGAGGLLAPLNETDTVLDIIMPTYQVVVVSRHYLGSINHTLLTLNWLTIKGYDVSLIFSGNPNPHTESIILHKTGVSLIGRIEEEETFDKLVIKKYAERFAPVLKAL
ncbi:ATP-dependent dethiobiotin synthetase BioD, partial [Pricia sp.]|uniref:ATP-dependent dethiobiotin synthetase BioD n=1 Tax=Pricia sp. TaxID=2268138 RepID=UPI0035941D08